jgi:hypothetical protein
VIDLTIGADNKKRFGEAFEKIQKYDNSSAARKADEAQIKIDVKPSSIIEKPVNATIPIKTQEVEKPESPKTKPEPPKPKVEPSQPSRPADLIAHQDALENALSGLVYEMSVASSLQPPQFDDVGLSSPQIVARYLEQIFWTHSQALAS